MCWCAVKKLLTHSLTHSCDFGRSWRYQSQFLLACKWWHGNLLIQFPTNCLLLLENVVVEFAHDIRAGKFHCQYLTLWDSRTPMVMLAYCILVCGGHQKSVKVDIQKIGTACVYLLSIATGCYPAVESNHVYWSGQTPW